MIVDIRHDIIYRQLRKIGFYNKRCFLISRLLCLACLPACLDLTSKVCLQKPIFKNLSIHYLKVKKGFDLK